MKKIFIAWLCISVTISFIFGYTFMSKSYFERFKDFPDFMDVFYNVISAFKNVSIKFVAIKDLVSFFTAIGAIFQFLFALLTLPFYLIGYIIKVINFLLPFDLDNSGRIIGL